METRANTTLVGAAVVIAVAALLGFIVWLAQVGLDQEIRLYDIYFEGSVAGLGEGGDVTYRGIKVGEVQKMRIDAEDPTRVWVTVEIVNTPIREGDEASLELQGITGVVFVNIVGAVKGDPPLQAGPDEPRPVIPSRPSPFEEMMAEAPDIFTKTNLVLDRLGGLLNEGNQEAFSSILSETQSAIEDLNRRGDQLGNLLETLDRSSTDVEATLDALHRAAEGFAAVAEESQVTLEKTQTTLDSIEGVVTGDVRDTLAAYRDTATGFDRSLNAMADVLEENRDAIGRFSGEGLPELVALTQDARQLINRLTALTESLETQGAGALLVPKTSEREVEP